jgi:hypothetical protein
VEETTVSRSPETLNLLNPSPPTNRKTTVKSSRERKRERERERERELNLRGFGGGGGGEESRREWVMLELWVVNL